MCSQRREKEAGQERHPGKMGIAGAPWTELRPCWENTAVCLSPNQAISSLILVGKLHTLPRTSRIQAWEGKFSSVCQPCGGGGDRGAWQRPSPTRSPTHPFCRSFLACQGLPELAGRKGQRLKLYLWEWWSDCPFSLSPLPFSDVSAAPEPVPRHIPDGPSGTLTSWETRHPGPVIPASAGNLKDPGQDVYRLWLKYLLFSQVPPPGPTAPSVVQSSVIEGSPDLPGTFISTHCPAGFFPFSRSSLFPSAVLERLPLTSISILASSASLLRNSDHFLRLWRKVMTGNAESNIETHRFSEP